MSAFASRIDDYIALRRALGHAFVKQAAILRAFERFVENREYTGALTQEVVVTWVLASNGSGNNRAIRFGVLRSFADYLSVYDERTKRLAPQVFPRCRAVLPPRILTDQEMLALLTEARQDRPHSPLAGLTLCTVIGLLASTGLRSGEALRLDRDDVDLQRGVLHVRLSKFRKSRLVPMHPTTCAALEVYVCSRMAVFPYTESAAFFLGEQGRRLPAKSLAAGFRRASSKAGLDGGSRPLRPHDLRHRFAVTRLALWHRQGVDVQSRLHWLATYLGHGRYADTAWYVTATTELLEAVAVRAFGDQGSSS